MEKKYRYRLEIQVKGFPKTLKTTWLRRGSEIQSKHQLDITPSRVHVFLVSLSFTVNTGLHYCLLQQYDTEKENWRVSSKWQPQVFKNVTEVPKTAVPWMSTWGWLQNHQAPHSKSWYIRQTNVYSLVQILNSVCINHNSISTHSENFVIRNLWELPLKGVADWWAPSSCQ